MSRLRQSLVQRFGLGLILVGGLSAQQLRIGYPLPEQVAIRWLRPAAQGLREGLRLLVAMPGSRLQSLRALRVLGDLQLSYGDRVLIVGLAKEPAGDLVRLRLRGSVPLIGLAVDLGNRLRAMLSQAGANPDMAAALLLDRQGRLLWTAELDAGVGWLISDYLAGRVDAEGLCKLVQFERSSTPSALGVDSSRAFVSDGNRRLGTLYWQPWAAEMRDIPIGAWDRQGPLLVMRAIAALGGRQEFLARILRRALDRSPRIGEQTKIAAAILAILDREDSPEVDLLGFVWHAQQEEDDLARSCAIRFIDRIKGVSARLIAFHHRLGDPQYGSRYVREQLLALDLALQGKAIDAGLLREKFDLLVRKLGAFAAADVVGRELVAKRSQDVSFLNSFAWTLLTASPYKGRMTALALHSALAMREQDGWRNYWRLDTLALAMFAQGRIVEAVEIQEQAVATCGAGSKERYAQRLERYRRAMVPSSPLK